MEMPFPPVEVFCSFAEADASLLDQLERHLSLLRQDGSLSTLHRRQIIAGNDWQAELDQYLNRASLILLLISPDFFASDYHYGKELQRAMERHKENEARVIPILLRPCDWTGAPFEKLQIIPRNGKAITLWRNCDEAFTEVAKEIRAALLTLQDLTVSTPRSSLPKIWQIPYTHNQFFTGREDLLQQLKLQFETDHTMPLSQPQIQAISGLGGIGKTQLAVEYAYQSAQQYQAIFWVNAETRASLISGYTILAHALHLPEKEEQDQRIMLQAVQNWLQTHTKWLLILDNADDLKLVQSFLPPVYGGRVLITTRAYTPEHFAHRIEIDTLTNDDGALLLLRRASLIAHDASLKAALPTDLSFAHMLSEELGDLPLALDQAGAYFDETQCSLSDYYQLYQTRKTLLLQRRGGVTLDHPEAVATTWSLSFAKIKQQNPVAAELLSCCAFLHPNAIPEELFTSGTTHMGKRLQQLGHDTLAFDEAIYALRSYSLIRRDRATTTLSIHRLVQIALIDGLSTRAKRRWQRRVTHSLDAIFPERSVDEMTKSERLLLHGLNCISWIKVKAYPSQASVRLLSKVGDYLRIRAQYEQAEPLFKLLVAISDEWLPPIHPARAVGLTNLGLVYQEQGRYEEAELLLKQSTTLVKPHLVSTDTKRTRTIDHEKWSISNRRNIQSVLVWLRLWFFATVLATPRMRQNTASSLNNLGLFYHTQGREKEAERLFEQALLILESLANTHSETVLGLNNLAVVYLELRKYEKAEPLLKRALTICEKELEANHPHRAQTLNNLGLLYNNQKRYEEAEPLYLLALTITEKHLGANHPNRATGLNNLGELYREQEKLTEAEPFLKQALLIAEEQLGATHPNTATSLNNLALLYEQQGKFTEAEPLYQRALAIREQQLGAKHPDTAASLNNLAFLYNDQKRYKEAEALYQRVLVIREEHMGAKHPDTVSTLTNLAFLYQTQQKYQEAEPLYRHALKIREEILGATHPNTVNSLTNLAFLCWKMGQYEEAESLYLRALTIQETQLEVSHPDRMMTMTMLASIYRALGKYKQAEPLYQHILIIHEQQLGATHLDTAIDLLNLADIYLELKKYQEAELLWKRALIIREQQLSTTLPNITLNTIDVILQNLAILYQLQGKYQQAEQLFKRILAINEQQQSEGTHPHTLKNLTNLANLYKLQGRLAEAEPLYERIRTMQRTANQ